MIEALNGLHFYKTIIKENYLEACLVYHVIQSLYDVLNTSSDGIKAALFYRHNKHITYFIKPCTVSCVNA